MTDSVVVEGYVKFRDGKKWKTRWVVLRKPSPVADCLVLLVFKDKSDKAQGHRERGSFTLEDICGLETGQWYEGVSHTLAIICLAQATLLGFDSKEALHAWDIRIRYSLGEVHRFIVGVLPGTKLESGPATLHLCNNLLALARDIPPVITGHWNLPDLRRYGPVPNGFVFEGGTRCGYWAGVFFLASTEGEQISFLFDCIVRGISPSRGPYGLQPVLPDPCANQAYSEERANHEAQELEKRLSMLSHRSSTALSVFNPCVAGDDRSISGSSDTSDTSHSDCSIGSRLAIWTEPATGPSSPSDNISQTGPKVALQSSTEKLSISQGGGCRAASKAVPRQLQEIGRQSSSDSGIATGSHSSYTGSFSSYTGSLDIAPGEEFGSLLTLPPHLAAELSPCTCPPVPGHEYQVPTSLRYLYDTPRNVLQEGSGGTTKETEPHTATKDYAGQPVDSSEPSEGSECCSVVTSGPSDTAETQPTTGPPQEPSGENKKSKVAPSCDSQHPDSCRICSSLTPASKTIFTICSACGGFKGTPYTPASSAMIPAIPDQSVDKSPCSAGTSAQQPTKMFTTKNTAASRSQDAATHSSQKHAQKEKTEETPQPKKGRDKLASLIAELLSYPKADAAAKANQMNSYESMKSALGRELESKSADRCTAASLPPDSQQDSRTALYEKCFKCRGQNCRRPLHVTPANAYTKHNGSTLHGCEKNCTIFGQPVPSGAWIRKTLEHKVDPLEQVHGSGGARRSVAGAPQCEEEEVKGHSVTFEDKRLNIKEERHKVDPSYEIMESRALEKNSETEDKIKYEPMGTCGQQRHFHESEGPVFVFPPEMPFPDRPRGGGGDCVTYVNIPISPTSKKELNYMELELQETSPGIRGAGGTHLPPQRRSSSKYAQIDITATETAHKVGTQHALGREEGLHTLDLRRRGMPQ